MYTYVIMSINFWGFVAISVTTVEVGEWLVGDVVKLARKFSHILDIGNCPDSVFVVLPTCRFKKKGTLYLEPYSSVHSNTGAPCLSVWGIGVGKFNVAGCGIWYPYLSVNDWLSFKWNTWFFLIDLNPTPSRNNLWFAQCFALHILTGNMIPWTDWPEKGKDKATCSICVSDLHSEINCFSKFLYMFMICTAQSSFIWKEINQSTTLTFQKDCKYQNIQKNHSIWN